MTIDATPDDFVFSIADIFGVTGRGVGVTGRIISGALKTGEVVEIWDGERRIADCRADVEYILTRDQESLALLLTGIDKSVLEPGQTVKHAAGA